MKKIFNLIGLIILAVTLAFAFISGLNKYLAFRKNELEQTIRFNCGQTYRYTENDTKKGISVSYPMKNEFEKCLQDAGL